MEEIVGFSAKEAAARWLLPRYNKLHNLVLVIFCFTHFTFAQEARIHQQHWSRKIHYGTRHKFKHHNEDMDDQALDMGLVNIEVLPQDPPAVTNDPNEGDITVIDDFIDNGDPIRREEHGIVRGIAQDLFFHPSEFNMHAAKPWNFLRDWTRDVRDDYYEALRDRGDLSLVSFLVEHSLGWKGMKCDLSYAEGCINMPPPEYIRSVYPNDRHTARKVIFALQYIRSAHSHTELVRKIILAAKERLDGHCEDFARTFFHPSTQPKHKRWCPMEIINMIVAIALAIVAIFTLGQSLWGLIMNTSAAASEVAAAAAEAGTVLGSAAANGATTAQLMAAEMAEVIGDTLAGAAEVATEALAEASADALTAVGTDALAEVGVVTEAGTDVLAETSVDALTEAGTDALASTDADSLADISSQFTEAVDASDADSIFSSAESEAGSETTEATEASTESESFPADDPGGKTGEGPGGPGEVTSDPSKISVNPDQPGTIEPPAVDGPAPEIEHPTPEISPDSPASPESPKPPASPESPKSPVSSKSSTSPEPPRSLVEAFAGRLLRPVTRIPLIEEDAQHFARLDTNNYLTRLGRISPTYNAAIRALIKGDPPHNLKTRVREVRVMSRILYLMETAREAVQKNHQTTLIAIFGSEFRLVDPAMVSPVVNTIYRSVQMTRALAEYNFEARLRGDPIIGTGSDWIYPAPEPGNENPGSGSIEPPTVLGDGKPPTSGPTGEQPPVVDPTSGEPPAVDPGVEKPVSDPSGGDPSVVDPNGDKPPAADPNGGEPPASDPNGSEPPAVDPNGGEPPAIDPNGSQPPAIDPSGEKPPATDPSGGSPTSGSRTSLRDKLRDWARKVLEYLKRIIRTKDPKALRSRTNYDVRQPSHLARAYSTLPLSQNVSTPWEQARPLNIRSAPSIIQRSFKYWEHPRPQNVQAVLGGIFNSLHATTGEGTDARLTRRSMEFAPHSKRIHVTPYVQRKSQNSERLSWDSLSPVSKDAAISGDFPGHWDKQPNVTAIENAIKQGIEHVATQGELTMGMSAYGAMGGPGPAGSWVEMEHFSLKDLNNAAAYGRSLYDLFPIHAETAFIIDPIAAIAKLQLKGRKLASGGKYVVRSSSQFTILPLNAEPSSNEDRGPYWEIGDRIRARLHSRSLDEALLFMNRHSHEISRYLEKLRLPLKVFQDSNVDLLPQPSQPKFMVKTHHDHTDWHDLLGGVEFAGLHNNEAPEMHWRGNEPLDHDYIPGGSRKRGENTAHVQAATAHHVMGITNSLEALNLISGHSNRKRDGMWTGWAEDNLFKVRLSKQYFSNPTKSEACGPDSYTGDMTENISNCYEMLNKVADEIAGKLTGSVEGMNVVHMSDWGRGTPAPFVQRLERQFHSYTTLVNTYRLASRQEESEQKVFNNLKNSMISKAYADENCYLRCAGGANAVSSNGYGQGLYNVDDSTVCRPGCYDRTRGQFEELYGLDWSGAGSYEPWNVNEAAIAENSYFGYVNHIPEVYKADDINVDPFGGNLKDFSPVLPVCKSDWLAVTAGVSYHEGLSSVPCTCGNMYGDEYGRFLSTSPGSWIMNNKHDDRHMFEQCLRDGHMETLANVHPAAYLINMCNIVYKLVTVPGSGSHWEQANNGHYAENAGMCHHVQRYYEDHKGDSDADLDRAICKIWAGTAEDFHHNIHVDFSHINSILKKHGCHWAKHWWKKDCHKGELKKHDGQKTTMLPRCGYPKGYGWDWNNGYAWQSYG